MQLSFCALATIVYTQVSGREVEIALKSSGVFLGGFATNDDPPSKLLKLGYHMVAGATDVVLLRDAVLADVRKARDDTKAA